MSIYPLDLPLTCGRVILTAVGNIFLRLFPDVVKDRLLKNSILFGVAAAGQRREAGAAGAAAAGQRREDHVKLTGP